MDFSWGCIFATPKLTYFGLTEPLHPTLNVSRNKDKSYQFTHLPISLFPQGSAKITVRYRLCLWHRGRTTTPSDETHLTAPLGKGSFQAGSQQHHGQGVDSWTEKETIVASEEQASAWERGQPTDEWNHPYATGQGKDGVLSTKMHCVQFPKPRPVCPSLVPHSHGLRKVFCKSASPSFCFPEVKCHLSKSTSACDWEGGALGSPLTLPKKNHVSVLTFTQPIPLHKEGTNAQSWHHWPSQHLSYLFSTFPTLSAFKSICTKYSLHTPPETARRAWFLFRQMGKPRQKASLSKRPRGLANSGSHPTHSFQFHFSH